MREILEILLLFNHVMITSIWEQWCFSCRNAPWCSFDNNLEMITGFIKYTFSLTKTYAFWLNLHFSIRGSGFNAMCVSFGVDGSLLSCDIWLLTTGHSWVVGAQMSQSYNGVGGEEKGWKTRKGSVSSQTRPSDKTSSIWQTTSICNQWTNWWMGLYA